MGQWLSNLVGTKQDFFAYSIDVSPHNYVQFASTLVAVGGVSGRLSYDTTLGRLVSYDTTWHWYLTREDIGTAGYYDLGTITSSPVTVDWTVSRANKLVTNVGGLLDIDIGTLPTVAGFLYLLVKQGASGGDTIQFTGVTVVNASNVSAASGANVSTLFEFWYDGSKLFLNSFSSDDGTVGPFNGNSTTYLGGDNVVRTLAFRTFTSTGTGAPTLSGGALNIPYGSGTEIAVSQTGHGFTNPGGPIANNGTFVPADAASGLYCVGLIKAIVDANNFTYVAFGKLTLTTAQWDAVMGTSGGPAAGDDWFLGNASGTDGTLTTTPTGSYQQAILKATSSTDVLVDRGDMVSMGGGLLPTSAATVTTLQSTSSTTYADLTTVGPAVTLVTNTSVLVTVSCYGNRASGAGNIAFMSAAVSGASTVAAADTNGARASSPNTGFNFSLCGSFVLTGLTPGSNTFTAKYKVDGSTFSFGNRTISVTLLN